MNIEITDTSASENFLKHYEIQWELNTQKVKKQLLISLIIYSAMIALGIFAIIRGNPDSDGMIVIPLDVIFISIGGTMLYTIFFNRRALKKFDAENLERVNEVSKLMLKDDNRLLLKLTSDFVQMEHYGLSEQVSWYYFSHYSVHQNLIIFHKNTKVIENFIVRKELVTASEYDQILFFCNENLKRFF